MPSIIDSLAGLAAKHKLVPFLGAGCSYNHTKLDWNLICNEMSKAGSFDPTGMSLGDIAQTFFNKGSPQDFCEFLKKHLTCKDFSDEDGEVILAFMSLGLGTIYTTNQDNVFELCAQKYGRDYKTIVNLEDLGEAQPGDNLFVKYHGHLDHPESIVFTSNHFADRVGDTEHFLNIKLKSDLLAKSFLFVGYSFRDPNIEHIFSSLNKLFKGKLPRSYLVAWVYDDSLAELGKKYDIEIINPLSTFPEAGDATLAFEMFFNALIEKTYSLKTTEQIDSMFRANKPMTQRTLSKHEVKALSISLQSDNCLETIQKFRAKLDLTKIPKSHTKSVLTIIEEICRKATTEEEAQELCGLIHNLKLPPSDMLQALSCIMTCANFVPHQPMSIGFRPRIFYATEWMNGIAMAGAIEKLNQWGRPVTENMRSTLASWADDNPLFERTEYPDFSDYFIYWIDQAWSNTQSRHEHPAKRYARLKKTGVPRIKFAKSPKEIADQMTGMFPKDFKKPFEE